MPGVTHKRYRKIRSSPVRTRAARVSPVVKALYVYPVVTRQNFVDKFQRPGKHLPFAIHGCAPCAIAHGLGRASMPARSTRTNRSRHPAGIIFKAPRAALRHIERRSGLGYASARSGQLAALRAARPARVRACADSLSQHVSPRVQQKGGAVSRTRPALLQKAPGRGTC